MFDEASCCGGWRHVLCIKGLVWFFQGLDIMYGPGSARRLVSSDLLTWNGERNAIYPLKPFSCMEQSDCIFIFQQHACLSFLGFWSGNFVLVSIDHLWHLVVHQLEHERSCFWFKGYFDSLLTLKQCWIVAKNEQKSMISALRVVPVFVWTFLTSSICPQQTKHKQPPGVDIKHGFPRHRISFHYLSLVQVHRALQQLHHTKQRRCGTRLGQLLRSGCNLDEAWPLLRELLKSKESRRHLICKSTLENAAGWGVRSFRGQVNFNAELTL